MRFEGSTSMPSHRNNTWTTVVVYARLRFFTLAARWQAQGPLVLRQYPTSLSNSFTWTPTKAITKPICVLPTLDSAHASGWAFKTVSIVFCAGRLIILLAQTHTNHYPSQLEGKLKSSSYTIFSFIDTVLPRNILADCRMRRCRK